MSGDASRMRWEGVHPLGESGYGQTHLACTSKTKLAPTERNWVIFPAPASGSLPLFWPLILSISQDKEVIPTKVTHRYFSATFRHHHNDSAEGFPHCSARDAVW